MKKTDRGSTARATGHVQVGGSGERASSKEREGSRSFAVSGSVASDGEGRTPVHVAVVHGAREVHFVVADRCPSALSRQLCDRLAQDAPDRLWQEDAQAFFDLRREGRMEQAIELYFREVGDRWDPAWLSVHTVHL